MKRKISILWAIVAAALYAISSPISKLLLKEIPPMMMAALLYLGAGTGMSVLGFYHYKSGKLKKEMKLSKRELPYIIAMILLDIAAPVFLMISLLITNPANVSLLNNFEIVATSIIALIIFKETINRRLWIGIGFITVASILLSVEDMSSLSFSYGSIFAILACVCWGFENNCTRMLSAKDPLQIVIVKGFGSGAGSLLLAFLTKEISKNLFYIIVTLILGFVSYGLSIYFYVSAQRELGAAKTSAYYAISPFIGAGLSFLLFNQLPAPTFVLACLLMIAGTYFASTDN